MTFFLMFLMVVGAGGIIGIPVRLLQLVRGKIHAVYIHLNGIAKFVVTIGLVGLTVGALSWIGVAYVAVMVFTDDTTPRIWGGSELGMTSGAFGFLYLMVELLLLPLTIRQVRNERVVSA